MSYSDRLNEIADEQRQLSQRLRRIAQELETPTEPPVTDPMPTPPEEPFHKRWESDECHYVIQGPGVATSLTLPNVTVPSPNILGILYRNVKASHPDQSVRIGVASNAGRAWVAGGYNINSDFSINYRDQTIDFILVGLTAQAEVELVLDNKWGKPDFIQLQDITLRGGTNKYLCPQLRNGTNPTGDLIFDGCSYLPGPNYPLANGKRHISGMSLGHGYESLLINNWQYAPQTEFKEHLWYLKGGGNTFIQNSSLSGGNRTAFQIRPHISYDDQPLTPSQYGDVVIRNNYSHRHGFDVQLPDSGGSVITVWQSDKRVWILDNEITEARYGCLAVSPQAPERNHINHPHGFPNNEVHIKGNVFTNPDGNRPAAMVSATNKVFFHGTNIMMSSDRFPDLVLGSEFAHSKLPERFRNAHIYGLDEYNIDIKTWDPNQNRNVPWSATTAG